MKTIRRIKLSRVFLSLLLAVVLIINTGCSNQTKKAKAAKNADLGYTKQEVGLLYSKNQKAESLKSVDKLIGTKAEKAVLDATRIPAARQPIIDRSNPDNKLLEKTIQMFKDAANF